MNTIQKFTGDYRFLSNFYPCDITYNGHRYTNLESAFQSEKCADPRECAQFSCMSASEAKRVGREVELIEDWDEHKITIMRNLLYVKFWGNAELSALLLKTGDAVLIEGNTWHDNTWGDCTCSRCAGKPGRNLLGGLLMEVRSSLREGELPEDIPNKFTFMGIDIEPMQLFSQDRILAYMDFNGSYIPTLDLIREQYRNLLGVELVWRYPILDSLDDGCVIIPVREGFLSVTYDNQSSDVLEYYCTSSADLLTPESASTLLRELNAYVGDLQKALAEMMTSFGVSLEPKDEPAVAITLPKGQTLRATTSHDAEYPSIRIELEGEAARLHPEPICVVEHNPNRPEGHQICICAYTAASDEPDYYKSYNPCNDEQNAQEEE